MASVATPPPQRLSELEDPLNRFVYHPLAEKLARLLAPTGVTPNMVSVAGMLTVWAAAWAYAGLPWPQGALAGFALHLLWHVIDGADGDLARLTGSTSPTGELVDGVCDYSAQALLYIVLAWMLAGSIGGWAWLLAALAAASHSAQTNHAESQRRFYLYWVYGIPWLKQAKAIGDPVFGKHDWFTFTFGWMARDYLKLVNLMTPHAARIDAAVEKTIGDPGRRERIGRLVRRSSRRSLWFQKAVGPNPRTILLGLSILAGSALYYFIAELLLLNLLLAAS
ncbi:MAG: CDP-alcohol phosphatidyltransferase family protein, partial [Sphingosinicella sp.]